MTPREPTNSRRRRFFTRWTAATAAVAVAGMGGFALRPSDSRPSHPPTRDRRTESRDPHSVGAIFDSLPTFSEAMSNTGPGRSTTDGSTVDFAACDRPPADSSAGGTPSSWVAYKSVVAGSGSVEFRHPDDWDVVEEADGLLVSSSDGVGIVVRTVNLGTTRVPSLGPVLEKAASAVPNVNVSGVRAITVGGHRACSAKATAEAFKGELVIVDAGSTVVVLAAVYPTDTPTRSAEQAHGIMMSVRVSS